MGGASSKEIDEGSAVTGKHCRRVVMPPGVVGEQIRGGMWPGGKFIRFTPRLLDELLERKSAKELCTPRPHPDASRLRLLSVLCRLRQTRSLLRRCLVIAAARASRAGALRPSI